MAYSVRIVFLVICVGAFLSCNSDDGNNEGGGEEIQDGATLIFGWFADDSCQGDCATIYRIDDEKVYRDVAINFPEDDDFEGDFQEVNGANHEDYEQVITQLPDEIFDEPSGYLDCPECTHEEGGFYLEYETENFHRTWRFRNGQYPPYMDDYRSLLIDKIADLNSL